MDHKPLERARTPEPGSGPVVFFHHHQSPEAGGPQRVLQPLLLALLGFCVLCVFLPASRLLLLLWSLHLSPLTSQTNMEAAGTRTHLSSCWMQMCNLCEAAAWLLVFYFPSGRIKPLRAECDKQSRFHFRGLMSASSSLRMRREAAASS